MNLWILEITNKLNRTNTDILFGDHAAKDKNLNQEDVENVIKTIQFGKVEESKSTEENKRVCFKKYFKTTEETYFAIVKYEAEFIKVVTVIKKKGKY
ncbi:hypothetical protein HZA97_04855 [Candidatus Woesearchaeota archaeon]|nr:hypothetical protein [Candidatus Woesearchaeota archaeon]